jgi:hypothetical protein
LLCDYYRIFLKMGLFKKIFRRKKAAEEVPSPAAAGVTTATTAATARRSPRKSNQQQNHQQQQQQQPVRGSAGVRPNTNQVVYQQPAGSGGRTPTRTDGGRSTSFAPITNHVKTTSNNSSRERDVEALGVVSPTGAAYSKSEHVRVISPRNNQMNSHNQYQPRYENENHLNHSNSTGNSPLGSSPRLSHQQLQQFDLQNNGPSPPNNNTAAAAVGMYTMSADVPRGQLQAMDDMNRSDCSSSSFNLSTDAEDSEYETLRRRGVIPRSSRGPKPSHMHSNNHNLDSSDLSGVTPYTLGDDERLFAGLHDDMTLSTSQSGTGESMAALQRLGMNPMPYPQHMQQQQPQQLLHQGPTPPTSSSTEQLAPIHLYHHQQLASAPAPPVKQPQTNQSSPHTFTINNETEDDLRAWNISPPSTVSNKGPTSNKSSSASPNHHNNSVFRFEQQTPSPRNNNKGDHPPEGLISPRSATTTTTGPVDPPASTSNRSSAAAAAVPASAVRNFTSPKSQASSNSGSGFSPDPDFATFVDFNSFGNNHFASLNNNSGNQKESPPAWREEKKTPEMPRSPPVVAAKQAVPRDFSEFDQGGFAVASPREQQQQQPTQSTTGSTSQYAHSSPGGPDTSLSELLAQAKNKQRRGSSRTGSRSARASSSSVNSAPAITASFLRQHHNLGGKYNTTTTGTGSAVSGGSFNEATSVTDIIQSLEATNQTRMKNGSRASSASYGHRSVGDVGAVSTARAAKERLREKRRKERDFSTQSNNRSSYEGSSSDNSDNEASESWLFDEVTGALGPRGVAADLESLSGRSNRSKNSQGNKSHRSHRSKSRRSRPPGSSRRHKSSSGDSVDSRGSRTSRNSRYSHRSTKSFISQMSEQSRSVANDLLRLEMQLAMVGSGNNENRDDVSGRVGGGSVSGSTSLGGTSSRISRSGRKSSTSHSRSSPSNSNGAQQQVASISHATRRTKVDVLAPPGKLGIILANKADSKGTVVSGVRTSSVLVDKISPGDRIVAIDGEDVSRMTVSEITTIMSRKADYDRTLTVLTIPKQIEQFGQQQQQPSSSSAQASGSMTSPSHAMARSPSAGGRVADSFDNGFPQYRR